MFETHDSRAGLTIYSVIGAAICFTAGYAIATYRASNTDVKISDGPDNAVYISYRKSMPRKLSLERDVVVVGTLEERLHDLLLEDPRNVRQTTRRLLTK